MEIGVAVAAAYDGLLRLERVHERLVRRGVAAVMSDVKHVHVARVHGYLCFHVRCGSAAACQIRGDEVIERPEAQHERYGASILITHSDVSMIGLAVEGKTGQHASAAEVY